MASTALHLLVLCTLLVSAVLASPAALSSLPLDRRAEAFNDVDGSAVFQQCTQRYNTSRMNPLPQQGYFNPNNGTNGSMLTVRFVEMNPTECRLPVLRN